MWPGIGGVCRHFGTKSEYLGGGLQELLDREVIDERLFEWGQALQRSRNAAAHASEQRVSREDASDLFDFVIAIADYVFVLHERFQEFMNSTNSVSQTATPEAMARVTARCHDGLMEADSISID